MSKMVKKILSLMICAVVLATMMPVSASALEKGVYTASVVTSYYNPDTGEIDDGGTANAALGEGMCRSATAATALVEYDGKNTWVTIRLLLQSSCKNVALYTRNGYNSYSKVNYTVMAEDAGEDSIDYRFKVTDAGVKMKGTMYVTPMGRDVLWYLYINTSTLKKGSGDFVVSIDTSESTPASTTPASSGKTAASAPATTGKGASAAAPSSASDANAAKSDDGKNADDAGNSGSTEDQDADDADADENTDSDADGDGLTDDENSQDADGENADSDSDQDADEDGEKNAEESGGISGAAVAAGIIAVLAVAGAAVFYFIRRKK